MSLLFSPRKGSTLPFPATLPFLATLLAVVTLGCGPLQTAPLSTTVHAHLQGSVHGGQQPVTGSLIQLWQFGGGLDQSAATPLLTTSVLTDANGNFSITGDYTCLDGSAFVYLTATGGNPGLPAGKSNPNLAMMSILNQCEYLTAASFIDVDEVSTVASVWSLGQFFSQYPSIGAGPINGLQAYHDVLTFESILNSSTGLPPTPLGLPVGASYPIAQLYTLSNIAAACINSSGGIAGDGSPCGTLFQLATAPAGTVPTNTVDALLNLQRNPFLNVSTLFTLSQSNPPYQGALSMPPQNWYMRPTFTGAPVTPLYFLCTTWGDSLTSGNEDNSGVTLADTLSTLSSCYQASNQGVGGQTSTQIAVREGGLASTATISGGVIPASGPVAVTFPTGYEPVTAQGPYELPITLSGVAGFVSFNGTNYLFTPAAAGAATPSPANSPYTVSIGNQNSGFVIFWVGRNDTSTPAQVLSDLAAMVASLPSPKHFLVLSIPGANDPGEWAGTPNYMNLIALNQQIAAAYPNNFLDAHAIVGAAYNPATPEDVIDHVHDVSPSSLRAIDDFAASLPAAIDNQTCTFATNPGGARLYDTLLIDSEKIYVLGADGNVDQVTSCIRGYAGTTPAPHAAGTSFTGTDYLHLSGAADALLAAKIDAWIQANQ